MNPAKPTVLFVCVHNAGRSQLAAGLAAHRGADRITVLPAGLNVPQHDGARHETWPLPDPADWDIDGIRPLRDHLDSRVQHLIEEITP